MHCEGVQTDNEHEQVQIPEASNTVLCIEKGKEIHDSLIWLSFWQYSI